MAIKRKTEEEASSLPQSFLNQVRRAFSFQAIAGKYEEVYKAEKGEILSYLESNFDGVEVVSGKALKTEYGSIVFKTTDYHSVDSEKIEDMIKTGAVSLSSILAIAKIDAKKLAVVIGEKRAAEITTTKTTESISMTATPDFKAEIDKAFSLETGASKAAPEAPAPKAPKPLKPLKDVVAAPSKLTSLEKAKLAASKSKVDTDLDAILGS